MQRRIVGVVFACFLAGRFTLQAQDFKLFDREVQIHGFASQGFVYTNTNNWLTMNSSQGSGAFTDFGFNVSTNVTDKLRVGAQFYDRNLGRLGGTIPPGLGRRGLPLQELVRDSRGQSQNYPGLVYRHARPGFSPHICAASAKCLSDRSPRRHHCSPGRRCLRHCAAQSRDR